MDPQNPNRADVDAVDEYPAWRATGDVNVRVRNLSTRHRKLLSLIEADLDSDTPAGVSIGHREAIAALLEHYYTNPGLVGDVAGEDFR